MQLVSSTKSVLLLTAQVSTAAALLLLADLAVIPERAATRVLLATVLALVHLLCSCMLAAHVQDKRATVFEERTAQLAHVAAVGCLIGDARDVIERQSTVSLGGQLQSLRDVIRPVDL